MFGSCIAREDSPLAPTAKGVRTVKDLSLVSPDEDSVVLLDDKPQYALNGSVIGLPEYTEEVCIESLQTEMKQEIPEYAEDIDAVFAADREQYPPSNQTDFSQDSALLDAVQVLSTIFSETNPVQLPSVLSDCSSEHSRLDRPMMHDIWGQSIECC